MSRKKNSGKLELKLLGSPEVWLDGQAVTGFRSSKARALLYYLAVLGRAQPRSVLAGLFWGGVAENHARRSLTMTLSNLRQLVGGHLDRRRPRGRHLHSGAAVRRGRRAPPQARRGPAGPRPLHSAVLGGRGRRHPRLRTA